VGRGISHDVKGEEAIGFSRCRGEIQVRTWTFQAFDFDFEFVANLEKQTG
jgi:hypothetical protein